MSLNGHKALYQPWNEDEFMGSAVVQSMDWLEKLLYRALLQKAFFCPTRPYLPNDDNQLWRMAGCESKQQWMVNKKVVLQNFTKFSQEGKKLLSHTRLSIDWDREQKRRQVLADKGRKGGIAKSQNYSIGQAQAKLLFSTEPNRTEQTEPNETEQDTDMSFKNNITDKCRAILGTRIFAGDQGWDEMNSLKRVHGSARVEEIFGEWAQSVEGETVSYPLTAFLRIADGLLAGRSANSNLAKPLILELSYLSDGRVTFNQKQSIEIARLLETCSDVDIKSAFKEFLDNLDENSVKYAGKDFSEKAEQIIYTQRKRKQQTEQTAAQLQEVMATERQKAEAELAKLPEEFDPATKIEL